MLTEIAEPQLGLDLVAFGDGDVAHVVAEAGQAKLLGGVPAGGGARPGADPAADDRVARVAGDGLAPQRQAGLDVAELAVAVGGLVEVHEVHVDLGPGQRQVGLGVQVQQAACARTSSPAIHALAGENVCIQAIDADAVVVPRWRRCRPGGYRPRW